MIEEGTKANDTKAISRPTKKEYYLGDVIDRARPKYNYLRD